MKPPRKHIWKPLRTFIHCLAIGFALTMLATGAHSAQPI